MRRTGHRREGCARGTWHQRFAVRAKSAGAGRRRPRTWRVVAPGSRHAQRRKSALPSWSRRRTGRRFARRRGVVRAAALALPSLSFGQRGTGRALACRARCEERSVGSFRVESLLHSMVKALWVGSLAGGMGCTTAVISLLPESGDAGVSHADVAPFDSATAPTPVSRWNLDTDAADMGPGRNDGTLVGGASFTTDAIRGAVLSCNGVDAAVRIANRTGPSFTYAAWMWSNTPSTMGSSAIEGDALLW